MIKGGLSGNYEAQEIGRISLAPQGLAGRVRAAPLIVADVKKPVFAGH